MKKWLERLMKQMKDEKGLTLIELLAVIVILGIIAAIAVPSITGITSNTKKEAHRANATQIVEAAKQYVTIKGYKEIGGETEPQMMKAKTDGTAEDDKKFGKGKYMQLTLDTLIDDGYFSGTGIEDPEESGKKYNENTTIVYIEQASNNSYNFWINLNPATGSAYFANMNYADILDGDAEPQ